MPAQTVYINGRFFSQRVTGVQRYAREALAALDAILTERSDVRETFVVLTPRAALVPNYERIRVRRVGVLEGHAWEQFELPYHARDGLLLGFTATGPLVKRAQLTTIHDAAVVRVPDAFSLRFRLWYRVVTRAVAARAPRVLSVTEFSAGEASACFGCRRAQITVTGAGFEHLSRAEPDGSILAQHGLAPTRYVLAVSSPTPNKNFAAVRRAAELVTMSTVSFAIAGAADPSVFKGTRLEGAPRVKMLGYVSDSELRALYQNALAFVFPSFYEGFGLPALEAMSEGCPVLASDIPALREVCQDAALYFDPRNAAELAALIERLAKAPTLGEHLRARGHLRARAFSWRTTAERILACVTALRPEVRAHGAAQPLAPSRPTPAGRARVLPT